MGEEIHARRKPGAHFSCRWHDCVHSPVVRLRPYPPQPQLGDLVGSAVSGGDQAVVLQFAEQPLGAASPVPSIPRNGSVFDDATVLVLFHENAAALSQQVKHPLFSFGNVH